jgi:hypothetical protein
VTTIKRCSERRVNSTHDAGFTVTDAAATMLCQGRFPSNHAVSCDCGESEGKIKPQDCQNVNIRDGDGNLIARFATKEFGAQRADDGTIVVYRRPAAQVKATKDAKAKFSLGDLNNLNREHYGQTERDENAGNLNRPHEGRL